MNWRENSMLDRSSGSPFLELTNCVKYWNSRFTLKNPEESPMKAASILIFLFATSVSFAGELETDTALFDDQAQVADDESAVDIQVELNELATRCPSQRLKHKFDGTCCCRFAITSVRGPNGRRIPARGEGCRPTACPK